MEQKKFKVGDLVKVKENIQLTDDFLTCSFVDNMLQYRGQIFTIENVEDISKDDNTLVRYKLVGIPYYVFDPEMLEEVYLVKPFVFTSTQTSPKFKVGDRVRIKEDLIVGKVYNELVFTAVMKEYCGKITIVNLISSLLGEPVYHLDDTCYIFSDDMLESVSVQTSPIKSKNPETLKLFL